jgi:ferredoxin--NADP+ reductase
MSAYREPLPDLDARPRRAGPSRETVIGVRRLADALVGLRVTRPRDFRFVAGRYVRLGLVDADGRVVTRPLSIASGTSEPHLDFLCTLVTGGELSAILARSVAGDAAFVERATLGFMTLDALAPGRDLWLLASGTGIAPFLSLLHGPEPWTAFERIVVVHSVRTAAELAPALELARLEAQPAEAPGPARLRYLAVVTREPGATPLSARIPALLDDGRLAEAAGVAIDVEHSRVMTCGNPGLAQDVRRRLAARGFRPTRRHAPGQMIFENYWQDRPVTPGGALAEPSASPSPQEHAR